jgi:hypothetical protein
MLEYAKPNNSSCNDVAIPSEAITVRDAVLCRRAAGNVCPLDGSATYMYFIAAILSSFHLSSPVADDLNI